MDLWGSEKQEKLSSLWQDPWFEPMLDEIRTRFQEKNIECIWNIVLDFAPVFIGGMTIAIFTIRSKDSTLLSQNHLEFRKYDYVLIIYLERSLIYCHCQLQKPTPKHKLHYCIWKDFCPQELSLCSQCEGCGDDGRLSHRKIINSTLIDCVNYVQDGLRLSMIASEVTSTNCQQTLSWCTTTISETRFIWNLALTKLVKFSVVTTRKL